MDGVNGGIPTDSLAAFITEEPVRSVGVEKKNREHLEGVRGSRLKVLVELRCRYSNSGELLASFRALRELTS